MVRSAINRAAHQGARSVADRQPRAIMQTAVKVSRGPLRQLIQVASAACVLLGRTGRSQPNRVAEVKELSHVHLRGIPFRQ
jgi:hypothetical protein